MKKLLRILCAFFVALTMVIGGTVGPTYAENGEVINIGSFEDLKPHLEVVTRSTISEAGEYAPEQKLELKPGKYTMTGDIVIDLSDQYFSDKAAAIKNGIISMYGVDKDSNFDFDGNGHTISVKQSPAKSVFGDISGAGSSEHSTKIYNLTLSYPGDVEGYAFARDIYGRAEKDGNDMPRTKSSIKNVNINVAGNVIPKEASGNVKNDRFHPWRYKGTMAAGFAWQLRTITLDGIKIKVGGNIGGETLPSGSTDSASAFGLFFTLDSKHLLPGDGAWNRLYNVGINVNADEASVNKEIDEVLTPLGYIDNVSVEVGGSILAKGNNLAYANGLGFEAAGVVKNTTVDVKGKVKSMIVDNGQPLDSIAKPQAFGAAQGIMVLNNYTLNTKELSVESTGQKRGSLYLGAIGKINDRGDITYIRNNKINISDKMKAEAAEGTAIQATYGFINDWNGGGTNGVNWAQANQNNTYNIGDLELKASGEDTSVLMMGMTRRHRTGTNPIGSAPIPEASLKENVVNLKSINVDNPRGKTWVTAIAYNALNAKNNKVTVDGDISVKSKTATVLGAGHLESSVPATDVYPSSTEGNQVTVRGSINVDAEVADYVSGFIGYQPKGQPVKNNKVFIGAMDVKNKVSPAGNQRSFVSLLGASSYGPVENSAGYVGKVNIETTIPVYFGLGAGYANGNTMKDIGVFADGDIKITGEEGNVAAGGAVGYSATASFENVHAQIDGAVTMSKGKPFGGFGGLLKDSTVKNSTVLILSDAVPFANKAFGGNIDGSAHYVGKKTDEKDGLLLRALSPSGGDKVMVTNTTLLVDKENEDRALFLNKNVTADSKDNYLVVVDNSDVKKPNRQGYKTKDVDGTQVIDKDSKVGELGIAKRSFQDEYWNTNIKDNNMGSMRRAKRSAAEPGEGLQRAPEAGTDWFSYVTAKKMDSPLEYFGTNANAQVQPKGDTSNAKLESYFFNRSLAVRADGLTYDLLGIKGSDYKPETNVDVEKPDNGSTVGGGTTGDKAVEKTSGESGKVKKVDEKNKAVKTGDSSNITLWIVLMAVAAAALGVIIVNKLRKVKKNE